MLAIYANKQKILIKKSTLFEGDTNPERKEEEGGGG